MCKISFLRLFMYQFGNLPVAVVKSLIKSCFLQDVPMRLVLTPRGAPVADDEKTSCGPKRVANPALT